MTEIKSLLEQIEYNQFLKGIRDNSDAILGASDDVHIEAFLAEGFSELPEESLFEELTDNEKYKADRMRGSGHDYYQHAFLDHNPNAAAAFRNSTEQKGRIRVPVTLKSETATPNPLVKGYLSTYGYDSTPDEYRQGLASKKITVGDPSRGIPHQEKTVQKKIGGILTELKAEPKLHQAFANDPARSGTKNGDEFDIVMSHNHHDVYGMSTGRGWVSCASMRHGESRTDAAARKMNDEINNHTHVSYLVPRGGNPDTDAIARIVSKHHTGILSGHQTIIPESTVYGVAPHGFKQAVHDIHNKLFPLKDGEIYTKNPNVYNDNGKVIHVQDGQKIQPSDLDTIWKKSKPNSELRHILPSMVEPNQKYSSKNLTATARHLGDIHSAIAKNDFTNAVSAVSDHAMSMTDEQHRAYKRQPSSNELEHKIVGTFDPKNPEHVDTMILNIHRHGGYGYDIAQKANYRAMKAPIYTEQDAVDNFKYRKAVERGIETGSYDLRPVIAADHKIGGNVFEKLSSRLSNEGLLDHSSAQQIYHALPEGQRKGNWYDHVVGLTKNPAIHQADNILNSVADKLSKQNSKSQATSFFYSKPETRRILGDKMGVDPTKIIKPHLAELKKQKEDAKLHFSKS